MEVKQVREQERRERSGLHREKMVRAAFDCFCKKGIAGTSIADVAREAQFGEATLYRYFTNKETLALACGELFWRMVSDFMEQERNAPDFVKKSGLEQVEAAFSK